MKLNFFRDTYNPATTPIISSWVIPERRTLFLFRYFWPVIRIVATLLIISIAILPLYGWEFLVFLVTLYTAWLLVTHILQNISALYRFLRQLRHFIVIIALFMIVETSQPQNSVLWLLYFIPILTIGVELDRKASYTIIILAAIFAFFSSFPYIFSSDFPGTDLVTSIGNGSLKVVIILYVGFTSYLISRSLAYTQLQNERLLRLLPTIMSEPFEWGVIAQHAVEIVADLFDEEDEQVVANLYTIHDKEPSLTATSSSSDQQFVDKRIYPSQESGVVGSVARTGTACFVNDMDRDAEKQLIFPQASSGIKAEMAVPIIYLDNVVAILNATSKKKYSFGIEDMQILQFISTYVTEAYRQKLVLDKYEKVAELSNSLAYRILSFSDIGILLNDIGQVAMDVLAADVIGFYFKDPLADDVKGPYISGELLHEESRPDPQNYVNNIRLDQLFSEARLRIYPDAQQETDLVSHNSRQEEPSGVLPFVIREEIISAAVAPLAIGREVIGLMLVCYRASQDFHQELIDLIEIISPLAGLAIQSSIKESSTAVLRRQRLYKDLHDSIAHRLIGAERAIGRLKELSPDTEDWRDMYAAATKYIQSANRIIGDLRSGNEVFTLRSIVDELNRDAWLIKTVYKMEVKLDIEPVSDRAIVLWAGNQILFSLDEALYNAARHSNASCIDVNLSVVDSYIQFTIKDDGIGFNEQKVKLGSGLYNMRARVEKYLGGRIDIIAGPGSGTEVIMQFPISTIFLEEE